MRRHLQLGHDCIVVAPSKLARQSGDKIKTDKRDAAKLARSHRAGDLVAIYIPEATDEAIRDLCRARTDAVDDQRRARQRLKAFLLQHGFHYQGKAHCGQAPMRYLRELVLPHPAMRRRAMSFSTEWRHLAHAADFAITTGFGNGNGGGVFVDIEADVEYIFHLCVCVSSFVSG